MADPRERKDARSPLERVTGENDVSPEEERERGASPPDGKDDGIQGAVKKLKDAAQEVMGTGKRDS
ncbi:MULTISPECIES: hypothetical protein [Streptomyces]|uniref:hypothetical protein n=1 Tax=Streptomyces TaxID=1883 RepID=UPI001600D4BF|nr:hypothetical protein [Streptomyces sp. gCLA4]MBZ9593862.1 hypothetical protein [Streptomyces erythrochromogenes]